MKDTTASGRSDDLEDALIEAWPDGPPASELRLAARLSAEMRKVVADRLRAVMTWTGQGGVRPPNVSDPGMAADGTPRNVTDAAAAAGLGRARFYGLVAEWRKSPSIAGLGARASEKPARKARLDPSVRDEVTKAIRDLLRESPDAGVKYVRDYLVATDVPVPSPSMIRRLWLEVRRTGPPGLFGEELVFDSIGLDAFLDGQRMRLYVVLDRGTGYVLGWARATNRSGAWGHVHAADHAVEHFGSDDFDCFLSSAGELSVVITSQKDDLAGSGVLERSLRAAGIHCRSTAKGLGQVAVGALGERLGLVWFGAGKREDRISYRNGRPSRMPEYTMEMHLALEAAIEEHNAARRAAAHTPSAGQADDSRATTVRRAISLIASCGNELGTLPSYDDDSFLPDDR